MNLRARFSGCMRHTKNRVRKFFGFLGKKSGPEMEFLQLLTSAGKKSNKLTCYSGEL